jgi:TolB-like protein/Tfp pilus assembly protein PilF
MTVIPLDCWSESDQKAIREQLDRIVKSGPFVQSRRRQRFLDYIVSETLAGRGERLKAYNVALEVFDRPESFDPVVDPIVRIEAARLRDKLREYYEADGQSAPIRIELPKGSYTPHIEFRQGARPDSSRCQAPMQGPVALMDERPSLAVLPFVNMSATHQNDYLADGFADTLITELAKVSGLVVISRQSSFAFRDSKQPLPEIAAALCVRYLIEGSVHADEERMRVSAKLIDTTSDHSLWAERYDKSLHDFFAVQDEVCRSIVRALRVKLTPSETAVIGQQGTQNSDAHDELLRGLEKFWRYSREACAEAQRHFAQAVDLDPDYAAAHCWLARTYTWQSCMNWAVNSKSTIDLASKHARRAIELDEQSPLAHAVLAKVLLDLNDGENAVLEGRRACALDPNSADAKLFLAFALAATGHGKEALRNIETAMLLQPHPSSFYCDVLGLSHFALADYERAIAAFLRGIEINPSFMPCHYELAVTYGVCGRIDEARAEAAIVKADWPDVCERYFVDPALKAIWERGEQVAGLA